MVEQREENLMSDADLILFDEGRQIMVKVWLPGTHPESNQAAITLENLAGLRYFLATLALGNSMFYDQLFDIVAYKDQRQIGKGTYIAHITKDPIEPMKLDITNEEGEIKNIVRDVWKDILEQDGINEIYTKGFND
jgi:hypothetical protein